MIAIRCFLTLEVKGKINLYKYYKFYYNGGYFNGSSFTGGSSSSVQEYYISKDNQPLFKVKTNQLITKGTHKDRLQTFYDMISDDPLLHDKFMAAKDFSFDAIENAIEEYDSFEDAPHDYIITAKNDTIRCNILKQKSGETDSTFFSYKSPKNNVFTPLSLDTVNQYLFEKKLYKKFKIPGDTTSAFTVLLERGKITLYQGARKAKDKHLFAQKGNDPLVEVVGEAWVSNRQNKERTQAFYNMIADYPELLKQFKNSDDITNDIVQRYVGLYNKQAAGH